MFSHVPLRPLSCSLALILGVLACAAPGPPSVPCALVGPLSPEDAIVEATGLAGFMLLDGRPLVVPRAKWNEAGCNLAVLRVPPGAHTVHATFQVTGFSPYAAISYSALDCPFDAEPRRHYLIDCSRSFSGKDACELSEAESGRQLSRWQRSKTDLDAYFEIVRAYAECGDELGLSEMARLKASGRLRRSPEDWEIAECQALIDLRAAR